MNTTTYNPEVSTTPTTPSVKPVRHTLLAAATFVLILALVVSASSWLYMHQQDQINTLNAKVTNLTNQLALRPITAYTSPKNVHMNVYLPTAGAKITSPFTVVGMVPGNWSQEASFPVQLKNSAGTVVSQAAAQVHGGWMTEELRPFTATLTFTTAQTGTGTLVISNANPSGLAENADSISIPVRF